MVTTTLIRMNLSCKEKLKGEQNDKSIEVNELVAR